jgi:uncharacterized membrane protein YdjX (TVP38/TMEM64 family)
MEAWVHLFKSPYVRKIGALLLIIGLFVLFVVSDTLHNFITASIEWGRPFIVERSVLGMLIFALLSAVSAMLAFFSTAIVVPLALSAWGRPTTILLLWGGWFIGGFFSYLVGRYPGRHFLGWALSPEKTEKFEHLISRNATFLSVLLFQFVLPSEIPGYVLGAIRYRMGYYLAALALVNIPFALATVYLGGSFLERNYLVLGVVGLLVILFSCFSGYWLYKKVKE